MWTSSTAWALVFSIARAATPEERRPRNAVGKSAYCQGESTSNTSKGSRVAAAAKERSAVSSDRANGPGAPGGGGGSSGFKATTSYAASIPSGFPQVTTTTREPGLATRLASARAAPGRAAY